jgi:hypothetical protein
MAWKIVKDYITPKDDDTYAVGRGQGVVDLKTAFTFRLLDDDGEVYYGGIADAASAEDDEDEGGLYQANQWGEYFAGATDLQVHVEDAIKHGLSSQKYVDQLLSGEGNFTKQAQNLAKQGWVSIYG